MRRGACLGGCCLYGDLQESCPVRNSHISLYVIREHMLTMGKQRDVEVFMAAGVDEYDV